MTMRTASFVTSLSRRVSFSSAAISRRNIAIGTDLINSSDGVTLQAARPWYMSDAEGSNLAKDNAVTMKELFENKTVAIFGVPAPFTGTCTNEHYPPYKMMADEFKTKGDVDELICYAVSDPYAHHGWSLTLKNDPDQIKFLADHGGQFAKKFGIDVTYDDTSLGLRSSRFSMIVEDGTVTAFNIVDDATKDAETLFSNLLALKEKKAA